VIRHESTTDADIVALFRARHLELVRLAALLLADYAAAEDVVQDVFTRVWAARQRLADDGVSPGYFYTSVVNACRSVHRRRATARRFGGSRDAAQWSEPAASAETVVLSADEDSQVLRALASLPNRQREALILRYYQRLTEAEIAEVMRISCGTVKSTTSRGLATLARRLRQEGHWPGTQ
jgi:RNA polymerase sigma-70 factor (sigma-E family)